MPELRPAAEHRGETVALELWRRRHEIRRSNAAVPIPSGKQYKRSTKHRKRGHQ